MRKSLLVACLTLAIIGCGSSTPVGGNKDYDRPKETAEKKG